MRKLILTATSVLSILALSDAYATGQTIGKIKIQTGSEIRLPGSSTATAGTENTGLNNLIFPVSLGLSKHSTSGAVVQLGNKDVVFFKPGFDVQPILKRIKALATQIQGYIVPANHVAGILVNGTPEKLIAIKFGTVPTQYVRVTSNKQSYIGVYIPDELASYLSFFNGNVIPHEFKKFPGKKFLVLGGTFDIESFASHLNTLLKDTTVALASKDQIRQALDRTKGTFTESTIKD